MEARGPAGGKALARRASFVFLAFLLASLLSLPITSAKALPTVDARLRDCRKELLVDDLDFGVAVLESEGIILVKMKYRGVVVVVVVNNRGRWGSSFVKFNVIDQLFPFGDSELCLLLLCTTTT